MEIRTNPAPKRGRRNIFCPYYSDCMDTVIKKRWSNWNCGKCEQRSNRSEPEIPLNVNYTIAYYKPARND